MSPVSVEEHNTSWFYFVPKSANDPHIFFLLRVVVCTFLWAYAALLPVKEDFLMLATLPDQSRTQKLSVCVCVWVERWGWGWWVGREGNPPPSHPVWHTQISKDTLRWDHSWWDHRVSESPFVSFPSFLRLSHLLFVFPVTSQWNFKLENVEDAKTNAYVLLILTDIKYVLS